MAGVLTYGIGYHGGKNCRLELAFDILIQN